MAGHMFQCRLSTFVSALSRLLAASSPFSLLQEKRARSRRRRLPATIPPAPFLSGVRDGVREGGGLGNRRAVVYRLDRLVSRSRSCSLLRSTAELGCSDVVAATAPLRWRITSGEEGGPCIFSGDDFVRLVCLYLGFAGGSILLLLFDFGRIEEA